MIQSLAFYFYYFKDIQYKSQNHQTINDIKRNQHILDNPYHHDPANGVPKIPTASSIQMRTYTNTSAKHKIFLFDLLVTFLRTSSQIRPVPNNRIPMIRKSNPDHFTSFVNCMAINGINNRISAIDKMTINLLFFITVILNLLKVL